MTTHEPTHLEGRRLERGPHDVVLVVEGCHPDDGAPRVVAPVGGEEAGEGGDEEEAAVVVHLLVLVLSVLVVRHGSSSIFR